MAIAADESIPPRHSPDALRVRAAAPDDIAAMHAIRLAVVENRLRDPGRITQASYRPYVAAGAAWVAERGGAMVGFAAADAGEASVWALFVAPAGEGQGVGRALHAVLLAWARKRGLAALSLTTAAGTRAERFYAAVGWRRAGVTEDGQMRFVWRLDD